MTRAITSDAGALLLGGTDRAIGMMDRLASCFHDVRCPELIEHQVRANADALANYLKSEMQRWSAILKDVTVPPP